MNYTIIGYTPDSRYYDRCGDLVGEDGDFTTLFFRDDEKSAFLKAWATAKFNSTYENLLILTNGIPEDRLEDDEYEKYEDLEREMEALLPTIREEHEAAEKARKEAAAEAALQQARKIAAEQRARDLAQLEALQRKLGVK